MQNHLVAENQCMKYHSLSSLGELLLELFQGGDQSLPLSLPHPGPGKRQVGGHRNPVLPELTRVTLESCWGDGKPDYSVCSLLNTAQLVLHLGVEVWHGGPHL